MTITKNKIAKNITNNTNLSITDSQIFVDTFLKVIKKKAVTHTIKISRFGTFFYKNTPKRYGRNPKTGLAHVIKSFDRFVFKASNALKVFLN